MSGRFGENRSVRRNCAKAWPQAETGCQELKMFVRDPPGRYLELDPCADLPSSIAGIFRTLHPR